MKDFLYKITNKEVDEISTAISESNIMCNSCRICEFCTEKGNCDCKTAWKRYIEQFIHDNRIEHKYIDDISDKVAFSMSECRECQIRKFCSDNAEYTTCNGSWFVWILKKVI